MSVTARAFLIGLGVFVLLIIWNMLEAAARGDPNAYHIEPQIVLTVLAFVGLIVGWLWIIKIGRDAGKV